MNEFRFKQDGDKVVILFNGKRICEAPYEASLDISRGLHAVAKKAEEYAKANDIIKDGAILLRTGFHLSNGAMIGLSDRKDIQKEIGKEAAWDRDLRRYMPGGVRGEEVVGTPTVINHGLRKVV